MTEKEHSISVDGILDTSHSCGSSDFTKPGGIVNGTDQLQRRLGNRQIQVMAVGGSIGTGLFITIGDGLAKSGPLGLLLGYSIYSVILIFVNNSLAEMTTLYPVPGGFIRMAGKWVDDALAFMAGWNFFLCEALSIPFEITAINMVLSFWRDDIPTGAVCGACIAAYATLSIFAVKVYGEAEFWGSGGKVILITMLFSFTFITMVGGNPQRDVYGFRYWRDPGPMVEYLHTGNLGRLEGVLAALWTASFTIAGPEFVNLLAAEAKHPRTYVKTAFKVIYWRFFFFYILAAISVGVLVAYNDPTLVSIFLDNAGRGTEAASPFILAMQNMKIDGLPHLTNALIVTTIFSAGNTYMYCASRSLYGLSIDGRAPRFLQKCTKEGVPIYCVFVVICFPLLSLLQLGSGSSQVLTWLTNLITAGGIIDYIVICITYIFFYRACQAQGVDRKSFPYFGWFQPYSAWIGLLGECLIVIFYGYSSFVPWDISNFFTHYTMVILAPLLYLYWKIFKCTKVTGSLEADLVWERPMIDTYEAGLVSPPSGFWEEIIEMVGCKKTSKQKEGPNSC
ncbi:AAT family amino acid transporter [Aspergillus alliaceus]|nr:AAT family amino acid transporter [Aspergillus alliaceus]KAB8230846.1 AAT family amino acid transporter [Aspergillus alliaceus]